MRSWGPLGRVPGGRVRSNFFFYKILKGLEQTLPTTPHLLYLDGKNKFLKFPAIPRPPRYFPIFPDILNRPDDTVAVG